MVLASILAPSIRRSIFLRNTRRAIVAFQRVLCRSRLTSRELRRDRDFTTMWNVSCMALQDDGEKVGDRHGVKVESEVSLRGETST